MHDTISKAAKRFVLKNLKGKLTFDSIQQYLASQGFSLILYNKNADNIILQMYELQNYAQTVNAFTFKQNEMCFVFLNEDISSQDKLYSLLHETAHIYLKHLDNNSLESNRLLEIQADAFVYNVLHLCKRFSFKKASKLLVSVLSLTFCICFFIVFLMHNSYVENFDTYKVYITPSGDRYHRKSCICVVDKKNILELDINSANKLYSPCGICNP